MWTRSWIVALVLLGGLTSSCDDSDTEASAGPRGVDATAPSDLRDAGAADVQPSCQAACEGRRCGPDGCGGSCGECAPPATCVDGLGCVPPCQPACEGRCCGDDGCGGTCGPGCDDPTAVCRPDTCSCEVVSQPCAGPLPSPDCAVVDPAPSDAPEVLAFVRDNAVELECAEDDGDDPAWDFSVFVEEMRERRLLIFGELHGTAELGPMSADLFEHLVRQDLVGGVGLEVGFDLTEPMQTFIETGGGPLIDDYRYDALPQQEFHTILVRRARALHEEGFDIKAFGVDVPRATRVPVWEIERLAALLPAAPRAVALQGLPAPHPPYHRLSIAYYEGTSAYRDHIEEHLEALCVHLDPADCEHLEMMVVGLDLHAFSGTVGATAGYHELVAFHRDREDLIYYQYRKAIPALLERAYAHMGALHADQDPLPGPYGYTQSAARLQHEYVPTLGAVFTTTPAWGAGTAIRYDEVLEQAPHPALVYEAMAPLAGRAYFVPIRRPGATCAGNPLAALQYEGFGAPFGPKYDGFVYFDALTPRPLDKAAQAPLGHSVPPPISPPPVPLPSLPRPGRSLAAAPSLGLRAPLRGPRVVSGHRRDGRPTPGPCRKPWQAVCQRAAASLSSRLRAH